MIKIVHLLLLSFLLSGCSAIRNSVAFHPDKEYYIPSENLPSFIREVTIPSDKKVALQGYYLKNENAHELIIYFHGNAGNIAHRMKDLMILQSLGYNVLGVSYRGYGKSSGKPSEKGLYRDGEAILDYAQKKLGVPLDSIILVGRSIGTTVAVHTAQNRAIKKLLLVTPMTSGKELALVGGMGILSSVAGASFDNSRKVEKVIAPLTIIHGTKDRTIPFVLGKNLYEQANEPKEFVAIKGAGHNNLSTTFAREYWEAIEECLKEREYETPSKKLSNHQ